MVTPRWVTIAYMWAGLLELDRGPFSADRVPAFRLALVVTERRPQDVASPAIGASPDNGARLDADDLPPGAARLTWAGRLNHGSSLSTGHTPTLVAPSGKALPRHNQTPSTQRHSGSLVASAHSRCDGAAPSGYSITGQ